MVDLELRTRMIARRSRRPAITLSYILAVASAGFFSSCYPQTVHSTPPDITMERPWLHDSVAYHQRLAQWLRDSIVVDSVSRTVPTDSLQHLFRTLLGSPDPAPVLQEIDCEQFRLSWRYGSLPVMDAVQRMLDTTLNANDRHAREVVE